MSKTPENDATVKRVILDVLLANKIGHIAGPDALSDDVLLGPGGLGISSLLLLHVFVKLEESFGFMFEDAAVAKAKFLTVGDLLTFSNEAVRQRNTTDAVSK